MHEPIHVHVIHLPYIQNPLNPIILRIKPVVLSNQNPFNPQKPLMKSLRGASL